MNCNIRKISLNYVYFFGGKINILISSILNYVKRIALRLYYPSYVGSAVSSSIVKISEIPISNLIIKAEVKASKYTFQIFGTFIGVGIIFWELYDHCITKDINISLLKDNLNDYYTELKQMLLYDGNVGIMSVLTKIINSLIL